MSGISTNPKALICVPGAWHTAAAFERYAAYFALREIDVHVVAIPAGLGVADALVRLEAARSALASRYRELVWAGHSSGGLLVQKLLERFPEHRQVLLASLPPHGMRDLRSPFVAKHPVRFLLNLTGLAPRAVIATRELATEAFFSRPFTEEEYVRYLQPENGRLLRGLSRLVITRRPANSLIIGAEADQFLDPLALRIQHAFYGVDPVLICNSGHDLMLDAGWEASADTIAAWIGAPALR